MRKVGNKISPAVVVILTILSFGIVGYTWLIIATHELRQYRGKGLSGWFILSFIPLFVLSGAIRINSIEDIAIYAAVAIVVGSLIYISWKMPRDIDKELENCGYEKTDNILNGKIQITTVMTFVLGMILSGTSSRLDLEFIIGASAVVLSICFAFAWMYLVQRKLNQLWDAASKRKAFAIPEKQYHYAEPAYDVIEDEYHERNR